MSTAEFGPPRRYSLRVLFFLGHLPTLVFALGIFVTTAAVFGIIDREVREITASLEFGSPLRASVEHMGATFTGVWTASLAGFVFFAALGVVLVTWTHRTLAARIARIVQHAEVIGAGGTSVGLGAEANDALGQLEDALANVAGTISMRDAARRTEQHARDQIGRIQRAMSMVDSEADAHRLVRRALQQLTPGQPTELLMAAGADSPVMTVAVGPDAAPPDCGVPTPQKCPAVQLGSTMNFADGTALDACQRLHEREPPCAALCVPITVMGRSVGVLHTTRAQGHPLDAGEVLSLETLSSTFGARVGLLRTLEITQKQAGTDPLTGLPNRRNIEEKVTQLMATSTPAAVVMADVDKFKLLNDTHGHAVGDLALQRFAQVLRASTRPGDVFGRWGGEEFFMMLPECGVEETGRVLERLRTNLARQAGSGGVPPFTVSFGVAEFPRQSISMDELIQIADKALYRAKEKGRDRVEFGE